MCLTRDGCVSLSPIFGHNQLFIMYQLSAIGFYVELALSANSEHQRRRQTAATTMCDVSEYALAMLSVQKRSHIHAMPSHSLYLNVWRFHRKYHKRMNWNKMRLTADFLLLLLLFCYSSSSSPPNLYMYLSPQFSFAHLCIECEAIIYTQSIQLNKKKSTRMYTEQPYNTFEASAQQIHRSHFFA